ncbi:NUDIX hydrolase [Plantactinospora sp. KLBMP9567]|uniref:NUDIX hydrolase n=1 Tax=Plantactinospora sp. KLBMP9567 TaxID=3085900 RepID=UPI0029812233|nr:NUDIX domain-containing protein [Plantactinospora sp. KLBMP9567]MDW5330554.1 NUDIX domain-containing protein [Plantactinospora sp. KLBMP9567]
MSASLGHSVSVAAVVVNDRTQILVIRRRDNGRWEPPGGVLERGESIIDGLRREVREETGLEIEPERLTGIYQNMPRGIVALVFRARVAGGQLHPTEEATRVEWWARDRVSSHMAEAYAIRVLDALSGTEPAVRSHDGVSILQGKPALPS